MLWAATGEHAEPSLAQDGDSVGGKILRMTLDGSPAPGNSFGTLVWTYGHRNVQGIAWDGAGRMYATEFGQDRFGDDKILVIPVQPGLWTASDCATSGAGWAACEGSEPGHWS
jgi:glucose/arabinose dehydrogenase